MTTTSLSFRLSRGVLSTISPPIPTAYAWGAQYSPTPTRPKLDMSQGVPGTAPHPILQKALVEAAGLPHSYGYCPAEGEVKLREGLVQEMKKHIYGKDVDVNTSDIALTAGCNMAFVASVMCLADEGDEVVLPVPWYFNHQMTLSLLGIKTVPLPTFASNGFLPSVENCKSLLTGKTRAIVLVTPNNPTGAIYPPSLISSFATLAQSHSIALILDETYRDFILPSNLPPHTLFIPPPSSPQSITTTTTTTTPNWRSHIISLYSFSKSYRIPGHRLGSITASPTFLHHVRKVLDTLQICPARVAQLALSLPASSSSSSPSSPSPASSPSSSSSSSSSSSPPSSSSYNDTPLILHTLRPSILSTSTSLSSRHTLFRSLLPKTWNLASQGGYYAFVKHPFKGRSSQEVCRRLAGEMGVVVLPGSFFCEEKETRTTEVLGEGEVEGARRGVMMTMMNGEIGEEEAEKISRAVFSTRNSSSGGGVGTGRRTELMDVADDEGDEITGKELVELTLEEDDRWVRFSVANVDDEQVREVCERLKESEEVFGWEVEGFDGR